MLCQTTNNSILTNKDNYTKPQISRDRYEKEFMKILIVEDNVINQKILKLNLHCLGYTDITIANTGNEALQTFSSDYDLIFMDIGLPDVSGIEITKTMRAKVRDKHQAIILCTALNESICQNLNSDDFDAYIQKPYTIDVLKAMIEKCFD